MDKHRICKICNRRFANGKAMGGHMRSHLTKLPIPPKPNNIHPSPVFTLKSPSPSSSLSIHSFKDHMQTYRSVNRDHSDVVMRDDGESEAEAEAESSRNPTKRRSKRRRKAVLEVVGPHPSKPESVSSVTENFTVEEVAICLLMLSRDKWPEPEEDKVKVNHHKYIGEDESDSTDEDESFCVTPRVHQALSTNSNKYKCNTCKKGFRSYQALGGHKASHKKIKTHLIKGSLEDDVTLLNPRVFKCTVCDKVFESGQALGGHKKVHFTYLTKSGEKLLDLNLPAPEDDSEVSQV
ncbi:zinc finger protein ZAT9-like [Pistacia vera]|uniref:zinc finger protein ZAT9-like n=1 Tax=Pistacia vera TaxID=55513 RepID=UPI0012630528|nr:zinc finger protein ZAT9-like [Pistacia vera]